MQVRISGRVFPGCMTNWTPLSGMIWSGTWPPWQLKKTVA
jgi:hypothetical protein